MATAVPGRTSPHNVTLPYFSPTSSTSTTPDTTSSPTSPRQSNTYLPQPQPHPATRQLRPPKSPLYVPAVLRPTERPQRRALPTPPHSMTSSIDSLMSTSTPKPSNTTATATPRPNTPSPPTPLNTTLTRSSAISTTGPSTPTTSASTSSPQPTRAHWKSDSAAPTCDAPGCDVTFSLLARRHHCRVCGGVFCAADSAREVPLNEAAQLDARGGLWRACERCYHRWMLGGSGDVAGEGESRGKSGTGALAIPGPEGWGATDEEGEQGKGMAGSASKDWNWSTF